MKHFPLAVVENQAKRRLFTFLSVVLLTISCVNNSDRIESMEYFRDSKTGLCFAAKHMYANNAVMTNVPCTPDVERLIQRTAQ
jgi:hypothetical protein